MSRLLPVGTSWLPPAATGVLITPNASAWANTLWVEVTASTSTDLHITHLTVYPNAAAWAEFDIGVGGSGSEVVVATLKLATSGNIQNQAMCALGQGTAVIPSGSRIAVRLRKEGTDTTNWGIAVGYVPAASVGAWDHFTSEVQQVLPASTVGTSLSFPGTWGNGSYVELTPGVSDGMLITALVVGPAALFEIEVDIATGAASSEVVVTTIPVRMGTDGNGRISLPVGLYIPPSERVAARVRGSFSANSARVAIEYYGGLVVPAPSEPEPGGEVAEGVNPAVADLPTGVMRHFFTIVVDGEIVASAETTLRDPADYFGGFKTPTLLSVSDIDRSLAPQGEFRPVEVEVRVADVDRRFRTAAQSATLSTAYAAIYVISDEDRYALAVPYRVFGGRVVSHGTDDGFIYTFTLRDALTEMIGDLDQAARVPPYLLSTPAAPGLDPSMDGKPLPVILGHLTDASLAVPQGVVSPILVVELNLSVFGGIDQPVLGFVWSHGAIASNGLLDLYVNLPATPDVRVPIPPEFWGDVLWMPGMPGWEDTGITTDYIDYAGLRLSPLFVAADYPPYSLAVKEGRMLLAGNPYGLADDGVGGNVYISDPSRIWQWVIVNQGFVPYLTGTFAPIPTLDGTYSVVNTDSVERTRTRQHARLTGGYPIGMVLGRGGQQQMFTHILGELCDGTDMEQGIDRHGRAMVDTEDVDAAPVMTLTDLHDIETGTFTVTVDRSQHFNRLEHFIGYRHTPPSAPRATPEEGQPLPKQTAEFSTWVQGVRTPQHDASIAAQNGKVVTRKKENYVVRDPVVAGDLEQRWLARGVGPDAGALDGPKVFTLRTSLRRALALELGDNIAITHCEGMGPTGYEGRLARAMGISHSLQTRRSTITGYILPVVGGDE